MRVWRTFLLLGVEAALLATSLFAQEGLWERAAALLEQGKLDEAGALTASALAENPRDPDVLVVAGTVTLYRGTVDRRDDSIFQPNVDPAIPGEPTLSPEGVEAVAVLWRQVPAIDPSRGYLWGDLAQLAYRSGDAVRAVEYAQAALADALADPEALRAAAQVFVLNLDWARAAQALQKIPGERLAILYQGLDAWRTGRDGWKVTLKAYLDNPGPSPVGRALVAYLLSPAMRDTEAGFLEAVRQETGMIALVVRQKHVERYPDKFQSRLDLARSLSQHGNYDKALVHYQEIDRRGVAVTAEEKLSVLFQQAWAQQGAGHRADAARLWGLLTDARDFYVRSAACWFLGQESLRQGKLGEAKDWWAQVAAEPARSKYAWWSAAEIRKLP